MAKIKELLEQIPKTRKFPNSSFPDEELRLTFRIEKIGCSVFYSLINEESNFGRIACEVRGGSVKDALKGMIELLGEEGIIENGKFKQGESFEQWRSRELNQSQQEALKKEVLKPQEKPVGDKEKVVADSKVKQGESFEEWRSRQPSQSQQEALVKEVLKPQEKPVGDKEPCEHEWVAVAVSGIDKARFVTIHFMCKKCYKRETDKQKITFPDGAI